MIKKYFDAQLNYWRTNLFVRLVFGALLLSALCVISDSCSKSRNMRQIERRSHRAEKQMKQDKKVASAQNKVEEQNQEEEKSRQKDIERLKHMQTAKTQKRMAETKKKSDEVNGTEHVCFLKKIFKRKKK